MVGCRRRDSGQVLIGVALLSVVLIGFIGVAFDGGYLYWLRRRAQTAADAGAFAGALEIWQKRLTQIPEAARKDTALNGYEHNVDSTTVTVNWPPVSGPWSGNNNFVEVIITRPYQPFFMHMFGFGAANVYVRAVGGVLGEGMACIHALDPVGNAALQVAGGAIVTASECSVMVNSSHKNALKLDGGGCLSAAGIDVVGEVSGGCVSPEPTTHAPPVPDPLAGLGTPGVTGCDFTNLSYSDSGTRTLSPGVYCNGIHVSGGTTHFSPGLYILYGGGMSISSSAVTYGTGVTFFNTASGAYPYNNINFTGQTWGNLKAPTSGNWAGLLMIQDPNLDTSVHDITPSFFAGGSDMVLEGIIYMPDSQITWSGGSNAATYSSVIGHSIKFAGNSTFKSDWSAFAPGGPLMKPKLVE